MGIIKRFFITIQDYLCDLWNSLSVPSDYIFWLVILTILLFVVLVFKKKIVELKPDIKLSNTIIAVLLIVILFVVAILMKSIGSNETVHPILQVLLLSVSALLTFLAFWVQYQFNLRQQEDIYRDRFESKFYRNLELFMDIEKSCDIPNIGSGKRAFHFMFYEYKAIISQVLRSDKVGWIKEGMDVCKEKRNNMNNMEIACEASKYRNGYWKDVQQVCYNLFISGVSSSSKSRLYNDCGLTDKEVNDINSFLLRKQGDLRSPHYLDDYNCVGVRLYDGHRLHLVPFFRNACMVVDYVVKEIRPEFDAYYKTKQTEKAKTKNNENLQDECNEKEEFAAFMKRNNYILSFLSYLSEHEISLLYIMYLYSTDEHHIFINFDRKNLDVFFDYLLPQFIMSSNMHPNNDDIKGVDGKKDDGFKNFINVEKVISLRDQKEKDECDTQINEISLAF